jgi:hypothetical protein
VTWQAVAARVSRARRVSELLRVRAVMHFITTAQLELLLAAVGETTAPSDVHKPRGVPGAPRCAAAAAHRLPHRLPHCVSLTASH